MIVNSLINYLILVIYIKQQHIVNCNISFSLAVNR